MEPDMQQPHDEMGHKVLFFTFAGTLFVLIAVMGWYSYNYIKNQIGPIEEAEAPAPVEEYTEVGQPVTLINGELREAPPETLATNGEPTETVPVTDEVTSEFVNFLPPEPLQNSLPPDTYSFTGSITEINKEKSFIRAYGTQYGYVVTLFYAPDTIVTWQGEPLTMDDLFVGTLIQAAVNENPNGTYDFTTSRIFLGSTENLAQPIN